MKRGEVYLCPIGRRDAAGHELLVPVVVLTREVINAHGPVVVVAPILEGELTAHPYPSDVVVRAPEGGLTSDGLILTMQLRSIPRHQLRHRLGTLSASIMAEVDRALRITLDMEER
jgi:mRNA interferase MazF